MRDDRHSGHTITRLQAHIVWVTKYRYPVLVGDIKVRCRDLLLQICDAEDVRILKGVVSKDHVHMHIEYGPSKSVSELVKRMKVARLDCFSKNILRCARGIGGDTSGQSGMGRGAQATLQTRWCKSIWSIIVIHQINRATHSSWNEEDFQSLSNLCTFSA
jgi:putative transposase